MNFKNYCTIKESIGHHIIQTKVPSEVRDKFIEDTSYFWKNVYDKYGVLFYRGVGASHIKSYPIETLTVRDERKPAGSSPFIFKILNKKLKNKFGFDRSNSLFSVTSKKIAGNFGKTTVIFPIGEFDWYTSTDAEDFNYWLMDQTKKSFLTLRRVTSMDSWDIRTDNMDLDMLLDMYVDSIKKNAPLEVNSRYEVMLHIRGKKYYRVNVER